MGSRSNSPRSDILEVFEHCHKTWHRSDEYIAACRHDLDFMISIAATKPAGTHENLYRIQEHRAPADCV